MQRSNALRVTVRTDDSITVATSDTPLMEPLSLEAIHAGPKQAPGRPGDGTETVLLVEDEDELRMLVREILAGYGYTVFEARQPAEALLVAERHTGPIDLLLTDVILPEMNGRALAERLRPLRPEMKVLYMSGYTDNAIVHHGRLDPGTPFIQKPFTPEALARRVREVLDSVELA